MSDIRVWVTFSDASREREMLDPLMVTEYIAEAGNETLKKIRAGNLSYLKKCFSEDYPEYADITDIAAEDPIEIYSHVLKMRRI